MASHVRQHFIPKFVLRNFCREKDKLDNDILYVFNNFTFEIERQRTSDAYMIKNLYDSNQFEDVKQLEIDLGNYLEQKVKPLFERLLLSKDKYEINRDELKLIKKYLLIQIYRSETNMTYYLSQNIKGKIELSEASLKPGEDKLDFWKREMYTIIHNKWDYLISMKCDIESIRLFASEINQGHLCFFGTNEEEFIINDLGKVSEMIPVEIKKEFEKQYIDTAASLSKSFLSKAREIAEYEIKNKTSKLETFMFFPISPNFSIVIARKHNIGFGEIKHYENSMTLHKMRFLPPLNEYINKEVYEINNEILNLQSGSMNKEVASQLMNLFKKRSDYFADEDKYIYKIQCLSSDETIRINTMTLNESRKQFSFKNPLNICKSIRAYNMMYNDSISNIKNNFNGLEGLLSSMKHKGAING